MKLLKKLSPSRLFLSKKSRSISRSLSVSGSFSNSSSSSDACESYSTHNKYDDGKTTPKSVLPSSNLIIAFKRMDKDGDGKIAKEELEVVFSGLVPEPLSKVEIASILKDLDLDGDGCVSFDEFKLLSSAFDHPACDSELQYAFEFFDADRDGRITAEELYAGLAAVGDSCTAEECTRMIRGVDANADGFVCFDDFVRMMKQKK